MKDRWSGRWLRLERAAGGLARHAPQARWRECAAALKMATFRLHAAERTLIVHRATVAVDRLAGRLEDLNPDRVLARGYSRTVLERTGKTLLRAAEAVPGDLLHTHLAQGALRSKVTESGAGRSAGGSAPADLRLARRAAPGAGLDKGPPGAKPPSKKKGPGSQATLFE
jgi:hypothetical protein